MSAPVPAEWTRLVGQLAQARLNREAMRSGTTQQLRDEATVRYTRAADAIIDDLAALSDAKVLGRITLLLARKEGS